MPLPLLRHEATSQRMWPAPKSRLHRWQLLACCLAASVWSAGCSLIDDFSEFRIDDPSLRDGGGDDDAGADRDAAVLCGGEDCSTLDSECARGQCQDERCVATPIRDGRTCGSDPCKVCGGGTCNAPKDCSAYDGPCVKGVCNPSDGACTAMNVAEGESCFDNKPCTVDETCHDGVCTGPTKDCSYLDDQCSVGECDTETGDCRFGEPKASRSCDDFNPCTTNDQCDASGICIATRSEPAGAVCTDYNGCTGTLLEPDNCDGKGTCMGGGNALPGTSCEDDNECTGPDSCNGNGVCAGPSVREGVACETACKVSTTCQAGACLDSRGQALGYRPECYFNWCADESTCQDRWRRDGNCDCGCDFVDLDCNACSARMCEANTLLKHRATKWCDSQGNAIDRCPESLKNDGKCDCGCQFEDPDCFGGACCGPTGAAGCSNPFVEACVCMREGGVDAEPSCCNNEWDAHCVTLAVQLGCMACP